MCKKRKQKYVLFIKGHKHKLLRKKLMRNYMLGQVSALYVFSKGCPCTQ